jgi:methionyl-tRNA formyltransferase
MRIEQAEVPRGGAFAFLVLTANIMRIVFMGTPAAAVPSLERLVKDGHDIAAVYTQPDRPAGRGNQLAPPPIKVLASELGLKVMQPEKLRTEDAVKEFCLIEADVAVVVAYGRILSSEFLNAFEKGAINVHFSLLPKYRGAAPVNWAIVNGEEVTGVTTMKMDEGLDTGDILLQVETEIGKKENAQELMHRLSRMGADLLSETLAKIDEISPRPQEHAAASSAPILKKSDGAIDWALSAAEIERRIRGFQPFPTSYTFFRGMRLTLWSADPIEAASTDANAVPGTIVGVEKHALYVSCGGRTRLALREVQLEGKRRQSVEDFINGTRPSARDLLGEMS